MVAGIEQDLAHASPGLYHLLVAWVMFLKSSESNAVLGIISWAIQQREKKKKKHVGCDFNQDSFVGH